MPFTLFCEGLSLLRFSHDLAEPFDMRGAHVQHRQRLRTLFLLLSSVIWPLLVAVASFPAVKSFAMGCPSKKRVENCRRVEVGMLGAKPSLAQACSLQPRRAFLRKNILTCGR